MKEKGIPTKQRKYILRIRQLMRRGIITFEYLNRRTCVKPVHRLTKQNPNSAAKKAAVGGKDKGKEAAKKDAAKK